MSAFLRVSALVGVSAFMRVSWLPFALSVLVILFYIYLLLRLDLFYGCYKDQLQRAMPHLAFQSDKLTIQDCVKACLVAGYTYVGAQVGLS